MIKIEGKKVTNIDELVDVFQSQEGEIQQLIGGIGQGKTYEATRRVLKLLKEGKVVYTNWQLILPDSFDQRESFVHLFFNTLFFKKRFYKIDYKKNWHWYDMDREDIVDYISSLTDCHVFCDEGQDLFDSYEGTKMSKKKRKSLTRTRHLNKTLVIVSQRAQAIAVTARANVNVFHKTVKKISYPRPFFQILSTEEMDNNNFPIWEEAKVISSHFATKEVFNAYNSWYLRAGVPRSQSVYFEAYDLSVKERLHALLSVLRPSGRKDATLPVPSSYLVSLDLAKAEPAPLRPKDAPRRLVPLHLLADGTPRFLLLPSPA